MARRDALDFQVLCRVARELENFGREVFENGGDVYCGLGTDAHLVLGLRFEEALDTTARELASDTLVLSTIFVTHVRLYDAQEW